MDGVQGNVDDLMRRGANGREVEKLQVALNRLGYDVKPDGRFGAETAAAVHHFQRSSGLGQDGVVGPQTYTVLELRAAQNYHVPNSWRQEAGAPPHIAHDAGHNDGASHDHAPQDAAHGPAHGHHETHAGASAQHADGWATNKPPYEHGHDGDYDHPVSHAPGWANMKGDDAHASNSHDQGDHGDHGHGGHGDHSTHHLAGHGDHDATDHTASDPGDAHHDVADHGDAHHEESVHDDGHHDEPLDHEV